MTTHPVPPEASQLPATVWLASRSPRRKELLQTLGIDVRVFLAQNSPEAEALETPLPHENPLHYVERVTHLKLHAACKAMQTQQRTGIVLAADTTVALGPLILGKPSTADEARHMLRSLSATQHQVHTCIATAALHPLADSNPSNAYTLTHTSDVHFDPIPDGFIQAYIDSGEPFDKAGAYGIQGVIAQYIRHISGSHSGIMGLPLFETSQLLRQTQARTSSTFTHSNP